MTLLFDMDLKQRSSRKITQRRRYRCSQYLHALFCAQKNTLRDDEDCGNRQLLSAKGAGATKEEEGGKRARSSEEKE